MTTTLAADDLQLERRRLTAQYLRLRVDWELEQDNTELTGSYETATKELVAVVIAEEKRPEADAHNAVQALQAGFMAEQWVELWARDEGYLYGLTSRGIVAVADSVRDWVRDGAMLDEIPMAKLAEPYLTGGEQ